MDPTQPPDAPGGLIDGASQDMATWGDCQRNGAVPSDNDPSAAQRQKLEGYRSTRAALASSATRPATTVSAASGGRGEYHVDSGEPDVDLSVPVVYAQVSSSDMQGPHSTPVATTTSRHQQPQKWMYPNTATIMPLPTPRDDRLSQVQESRLRDEYGFPLGLSQAVKQNLRTCPIRFWIVDNSGSMYEPDGHVLRGQRANPQLVPCTRWAEMQATVTAHAEISGLLEAATVFCLLNSPGDPNLPQQFSVAEHYNVHGHATNIPEQIQFAKSIMKQVEPSGVTPLTVRLREIGEKIAGIEQPLRQHGQRAAVVLATDGMPTDELGDASPETASEFLRVLQHLQTLPVWMVIRLCTDDAETVNFYNDLDKHYELSLEVVDDFVAEEREIHTHNPWLNYGLPMHRVREMGFQHRIFDLIDERKLNKDEVREFLALLFGDTALELQKAPDVHADWKGFVNAIKTMVQEQGPVWCPRTRRMEPWINVKALLRAFSDRSRKGNQCWSCFGGNNAAVVE